jgi:hypothetical protein
MESKSYAEEDEQYEEKNADNWYAYNAPPSQGGRKRKKAPPPSQGGWKRVKTSDALFDSDEETEISDSDDNLFYNSDESELEDSTQKKALHCRQSRQRLKAAHAKAAADAAAKKVDKQAAKIASKAKRALTRAIKTAARQTPTARAHAELKRLAAKADSHALHKAIQRTPTTTSSLSPPRQRLPRYGRRRWPPITSRHHNCDDDLFDDYDEDVQLEADEGKLLYPGKAVPHFTI